MEPTNAAAAGVLADNFGKFANAAFNGGCAVILGWLVVSEIPAMRKESNDHKLVITKALDDMAHELRELRRERISSMKPDKPANN